jgi:hypothetical protein
MVDKAESLFEELQRLRQGQEPSMYDVRCQAGLDELYWDHAGIIERWTNLLDRGDIYQPPVRRQWVRHTSQAVRDLGSNSKIARLTVYWTYGAKYPARARG